MLNSSPRVKRGVERGHACALATAAALFVRSWTAAAVARVFADTCGSAFELLVWWFLAHGAVVGTEVIILAGAIAGHRGLLRVHRTFSAVRRRVSSALIP